jgi:hypothetical protein
MKIVNVNFLATAFLAVTMSACGGSGSNRTTAQSASHAENAETATATAEPSMTMTTNGESASFALEGTGTVTIDWGDGSEKETAEIWAQEEDGSPIFFTQRQYPNAKTRTITISGGNITGLYCQGNENMTVLDVSQLTALKLLHCGSGQLTRLDVSKNTALKELMCFHNQFTIAALNDLAGTLHENGGEIDISHNPGTADFDTSVAEAKGWFVRYDF